MANSFDKDPTYSSDGFGIPEDDKPTLEQIEKGRLIAEYYDSLPENAQPSPVEPIFKDIFIEKDSNDNQ